MTTHTTDPVVWGIGSTRTLRVHFMLHEFQVPYHTEFIRTRTTDMDRPDFQAVAPKGKIPVLQHGDLILSESAAIITYIADHYPAPSDFLTPSSAAERAMINEWCFFIMTELDAHSLYLIRRHHGLKHIYGEAPEAVESAKAYFYKLILSKSDHFKDGRPYLFGDKWSIADVLLISIADWLNRIEFELPDYLENFVATMQSRPKFQAAHRFNYEQTPTS